MYIFLGFDRIDPEFDVNITNVDRIPIRDEERIRRLINAPFVEGNKIFCCIIQSIDINLYFEH